MRQTQPMTGLPIYRTLRGAALGGVSLLAIMAFGIGSTRGEEPSSKAALPLQVAQRPSQSQPPLTDKDIPWDQSRAETARDATKAMNGAIEGFKSVAQNAILTNNPSLLHAMKALIKYYGDLCAALQDRALAILLGDNGKTKLTEQGTRAVRETIGNGQLGKEAAAHALKEIEKFQAPTPQHSRAPTKPSTSRQTASAGSDAVFNTVLPADPKGVPTICGPEHEPKCTASVNDMFFAWTPKGIGNEYMNVGDYCRLSYTCQFGPGQSGMVQFSPTKRPEQGLSMASGTSWNVSVGYKAMGLTAGSYLNPYIPANPPPDKPVSPQALNMFNGFYADFRKSTGQTSANAGSHYFTRVLMEAWMRMPSIDHALLTDLSASNVISDAHQSFLEDLARRNPPNGNGGPWDYGIWGERRLATKQVLNEDFTYHQAHETVPKFESSYPLSFGLNPAKQIPFWVGTILPTAKPNDTILPRDMDWKGGHPYLGASYTYRPNKNDVVNGYVKYSFAKVGPSATFYVPSPDKVDELPEARENFEFSTKISDSLQFDTSKLLNRYLTSSMRVSSVLDVKGAYAGFTMNSTRSLRAAELAPPGQSCDTLPYPKGKFGKVTLSGFSNFYWQQIVPPTPQSGAVCELGYIWPTLFYSTAQQLVARRMTTLGRAIDDAQALLYSYYYGCDYEFYYYLDTSSPGGRALFEAAMALHTQSPQPNDPLLSSKGTWQQKYDDQWWLKAIDWMKPDGTTVLPQTGKPVTVAVIDTGLDLRHPELFGALWVNPDEPVKPSRPGTFRNPVRVHWLGWNFLEDSGDIRDTNGHGTIVAGIIAADVNNGVGIAGINPWAKIMPLKVADHRGHTSTLAAAKAIVYAADHGARVINMSLGNEKLSEIVKRAIDYAASKNVLIVVSAGNKGVDVKDFTPSAFASTIAVAAVDTDLKRAGFSNFGDNVTISAPGMDILSLRAGGTDLMQFVRTDYKPGSAVVNDRYYRVDGTSFAAPMVAGVASLILSMHPELSAAEVRRMILQSARDIGEPGRDRNLGYGLLDADAALKADPAFFVDGTISGLSVVRTGGGQAVRVTGSADANRMRAAWIEIGQGEEPTSWKKVTGDITRPVENGVLGDIDARNFAGAKVWTVRVVVEHQNGRRREGRFVLRLG